jgi:hypothetical protein
MYVVRAAHWLHEPGGQELIGQGQGANRMINNTGLARCCRCGCFGDVVVDYRHKNERAGARHVDVFAVMNSNIRLFTKDHILPRSVGGTDHITNMRLMCHTCNNSRGNHVTTEELDLVFSDPAKYITSSFARRAKLEQYLRKHSPAHYLMYTAWVATRPVVRGTKIEGLADEAWNGWLQAARYTGTTPPMRISKLIAQSSLELSTNP